MTPNNVVIGQLKGHPSNLHSVARFAHSLF